jgi:hypothetical protein
MSRITQLTVQDRARYFLVPESPFITSRELVADRNSLITKFTQTQSQLDPHLMILSSAIAMRLCSFSPSEQGHQGKLHCQLWLLCRKDRK